MKKLITFAACAALSTSVFAQKTVEQTVKDAHATDFSYTWIEVDYVTVDAGAFDPDGIRVKGSFAINEPFSIIGSASLLSDGPLDVTTVTGGVSYHLNVGKLSGVEHLNRMDVVAHVELAMLDVDWGTGDDDDFGIVTGVEARYQAVEMLEVYADVSYSTVEIGNGNNGYGNDFSLSGGVRFAPIELLQLTAGITLADDDELYLGARFNF